MHPRLYLGNISGGKEEVGDDPATSASKKMQKLKKVSALPICVAKGNKSHR